MPVVTIKIAKGRSIETKRSVVSKITDILEKELKVKREWITIFFDEYERENWASCGELHLDKLGPGSGMENKKF